MKLKDSFISFILLFLMLLGTLPSTKTVFKAKTTSSISEEYSESDFDELRDIKIPSTYSVIPLIELKEIITSITSFTDIQNFKLTNRSINILYLAQSPPQKA